VNFNGYSIVKVLVKLSIIISIQSLTCQAK
jgi:hypothetical protein